MAVIIGVILGGKLKVTSAKLARVKGKKMDYVEHDGVLVFGEDELDTVEETGDFELDWIYAREKAGDNIDKVNRIAKEYAHRVQLAEGSVAQIRISKFETNSKY